MNVLLLVPTALKAHIDRSLTLKTLAWLGIPVVISFSNLPYSSALHGGTIAGVVLRSIPQQRSA